MKIDPDAAGMDRGRLQRIDEHFRTRYVEPGKIAGCQVAVARHGTLAHFSSLGLRDREREVPVEEDTIWRLYSMTKPVTGVALLTLYEQGYFQLDDPVHRFIPAWRDLKVGEQDGRQTRLVEPRRPMSVRDLMMHMSGLGYSLDNGEIDVSLLLKPVPERLGGDGTLERLTEVLAEAPLRFHPGTHWMYSYSTDICARLVEILSGQPFDEYLRTTIFEPLGMVDTGFWVPQESQARLAANYLYNPGGPPRLLDDPATSRLLRPVSFLSGGGGLVGTTADYLRFALMLLNGGELDGVRVLGRKTVELMRSNHLPGDGELADFVQPGSYGETGFHGMGFGLTVAVSHGPVATRVPGSPGDFSWGGAASTFFWCDPVEELTAVFMTQLIPSATYPIRPQMKTLVYPAIVD